MTSKTDDRLRDELEKTYRLHRQGLFSLALSITGCRQLAEDAVHAAFERLCRLPAAKTGDLTNYVFASVRNAALDTKRQRQRRSIVSESIFNGFVAGRSAPEEPWETVLTAERDQCLRVAVDQLASEAREVIVLKTFAGLTFDAISDILKQPASTVATRYRRALLQLEEKLRGQI